MHHSIANGDSRLSFWLRVREFAVPPSMIESATARRIAGDWAGACAAAHVDVDLNLRHAARVHGRDFAARLRGDLRHLAPDLLRWHMPRIAPDGLLRPGLTVSLVRYDNVPGTVHLVARTPPAWADAGQRISLTLWDGSRSRSPSHPHPRPHQRFRLDLHRHLWDVRRVGELRERSGADLRPAGDGPPPVVPGCAVERWADEARLLLRAEGLRGPSVLVRVGGRRRLVLEPDTDAGPHAGAVRVRAASGKSDGAGLPVLPDAATWVLPDLALLRAGLIAAHQLHPLVAAALVPDQVTGRAQDSVAGDGTRVVECRGERHRIGLVRGTLVPLDHDPAEIRREKLLAALTGTPLPCLQVIDQVHRAPEWLADVRARLDHGDTAGALAAVEGRLGPDAPLPQGDLREELEMAAQRRIDHGLFRAGLPPVGSRAALFGLWQGLPARRANKQAGRRTEADRRARTRHAMYR